MKRLILSNIFFWLVTISSMCQSSFGLEFGHLWMNVIGGGSYEFDDIAVIANSGPDPSDGFGGGFFQYQISDRFSVHNKFNYSRRILSYSVFNNQIDCTFCPEVKVRAVRINSFGLEILPQFSIIKQQKFSLNLFAGLNTTINFVPTIDPIVFGDLPGVTTVVNSLDTAIKPATISMVYGASIEHGRIILWGKFLPPIQYSDKIQIKGQEFNFDNSWSFSSISLGYKFYSFRLKKKDGESR